MYGVEQCPLAFQQTLDLAENARQKNIYTSLGPVQYFWERLKPTRMNGFPIGF
jgi:hypothetical protein